MDRCVDWLPNHIKRFQLLSYLWMWWMIVSDFSGVAHSSKVASFQQFLNSLVPLCDKTRTSLKVVVKWLTHQQQTLCFVLLVGFLQIGRMVGVILKLVARFLLKVHTKLKNMKKVSHKKTEKNLFLTKFSLFYDRTVLAGLVTCIIEVVLYLRKQWLAFHGQQLFTSFKTVSSLCFDFKYKITIMYFL